MEAMLGWIIPSVLFVATVIGWAVKYGADQQALKSENRMQDMRIDNLEKSLEDEKLHNATQHNEFYDVKSTTIGLKSDMQHILGSLAKIEGMLERRRETRD